MKILFFGSSSYCLPVLESLHKNFQISAIITKPDGPTKNFALKNNLPFYTPSSKKELLKLKNTLSTIAPDLAVVSDYGLIIPREIFTLPKFKTLNIHFSKLPDLRGASPVQFTILKIKKSAWITVILMDEKMDTGDIIWQKEAINNLTRLPARQAVEPFNSLTSQELYIQLFKIIAQKLPHIINQFIKGDLKPVKQDSSKATYTKILNRDDGLISFSDLKKALSGKISPQNIEQMYRAFFPWPGIWTKLSVKNQEKRLKILKLHLMSKKLILDEVQLEGKKPVSFKQFIEGYPRIKF